MIDIYWHNNQLQLFKHTLKNTHLIRYKWYTNQKHTKTRIQKPNIIVQLQKRDASISYVVMNCIELAQPNFIWDFYQGENDTRKKNSHTRKYKTSYQVDDLLNALWMLNCRKFKRQTLAIIFFVKQSKMKDQFKLIDDRYEDIH